MKKEIKSSDPNADRISLFTINKNHNNIANKILITKDKQNNRLNSLKEPEKKNPNSKNSDKSNIK